MIDDLTEMKPMQPLQQMQSMERETLSKVNRKLHEIMQILKTEQTTPFSDTIVLLNLIDCARSVGSVVQAKLDQVEKHPKISETKGNQQEFDNAAAQLKWTNEAIQKSHEDSTSLLSEMTGLAEMLFNTPFFVTKEEEKKDESDTHKIITIE